MLPFIKVPTEHGFIKLLVDSGANINIISEKWANVIGSETVRSETKQFKSVAGIGSASQVVFLDIFSPVLETKYKFVVYNFHDFFDGIIGTEIVFAHNINLITRAREIELTKPDNSKYKIPLHFYYPKKMWREYSSVTIDQILDVEPNTHIAHLTEERESLVTVLNQHSHAFHDTDSKLTCTTNVE